MFRRASQLVAAVSLLICLLCPILETFDHWDHTAKTGSDTEYTFVVLGLCIGATYAFARAVCRLLACRPAANHASCFRSGACIRSALHGLSFVFSIPISPPPLALRI
ncbi:MAG TPA: hypothetical protein VKB26_15120 [Candidatus Acidoferrales bacterium]|nr:hypothetical protein [Candidatus Acidoferrales bacterium]